MSKKLTVLVVALVAVALVYKFVIAE